MPTPEVRKGIPLAAKIGAAIGTAALAGGIAFGISNRPAESKPVTTPTPAAAASPTPKETIPTITLAPKTPEPTPSLKPVTSLFEGDHPKVDVGTITLDIKTAIENNPQSVEQKWTKETALLVWEWCQNGNPALGGDPNNNKESACESLILKFYQTYQRLHDENFYKLAKEVYGYVANTLPEHSTSALKKNLEEIF